MLLTFLFEPERAGGKPLCRRQIAGQPAQQNRIGREPAALPDSREDPRSIAKTYRKLPMFRNDRVDGDNFLRSLKSTRRPGKGRQKKDTHEKQKKAQGLK